MESVVTNKANRVFEAKTGTLVKRFTLRGTTTPEETCPEKAYAPAGALYNQLIDNRALLAKVRPLVELDR